MIIIGFVFTVISFFLLAYYQYSQSSTNEIELLQLDRIALKIVDTADEIYFLSEPSKTTIKAIFPNNLQGIWINDTEITFIYRSSTGISHISRTATINLTGEISPDAGIKNIVVEAQENGVMLSEE